jgi:hypothetical protein
MKRANLVLVLGLTAAAAWSILPNDASAADAALLNGVVQTGGTAFPQRLAKVKVTLLEATAEHPTVLGQATTDASGHFAILSPKDRSAGVFYARAEIAPGVAFVTVLGSNLPSGITVNELTTVAAAYSMAQFYRDDAIAGDSFSLRLAAGMNDNLVACATGEPSPVLLTSPNADQTNSLRSTRSLANLLAACARDRRVARAFLDLTKEPRGPAPHDTAEAVASLARDPGQNVEAIYLLTTRSNSYYPALARMPDAWTLTVKVNDSGDDGILFGGPGNLAFDARGFAWVTNNVVQGDTISSPAVMVLQPNGRPAEGTNGTPLSPITSGGILGTGFGVTVDPQGSAWFGNFGWGMVNPSPMGNGSLSQFAPSGAPISGPNGYQGGPVRAQGTVSDAAGNIWIASFGTDSLFVFLGGDPNHAVSFQQYPGSQPFDIAIAPDGTAWVTNSGGLAGAYPSSVARFALVNGVLQRKVLRFIGKSLKGLGVDSRGNAWVSSLSDNSVYGIRPDGSVIGRFTGGSIDGPWDVTVDGSDNLWVANFGPILSANNFPNGRLTKLCGVNPATRPPGKKTGDPISPATGYTVHSAGSEVLLHNGDPLYGPGAPPSFAPMMRQTSTVIDQAGNVWSINNWKPDFIVDATLNPGGDGIVIFVGLAPPPPRGARCSR